MQLMRLARALGLFLVLGVFGSVVGCGSGPQQGAVAGQDEDGMVAANKGLRTFHKQQRESAEAKSSNGRSGKSRAKSGS
jgi:hypothetical protein